MATAQPQSSAIPPEKTVSLEPAKSKKIKIARQHSTTVSAIVKRLDRS
ncbi:hypothetical protein FB99_45250 (plasmid) [Pantoea agglomerans]|nr:hypothetical protein FB99_45250 [Pantoea agglomerans]